MEDKTIIMRNANKGGSVVVLGTDTYKDEALRQLRDIDSYVPLKSNPTNKYKSILISLINKGASLVAFSSKEAQVLVPEFPIVPILLWMNLFGVRITFGLPLTCDVSSLYSSIPHMLANTAISFFLRHYTDLSLELRTYILETLDFLLTHNYFVFDGIYYL